MPRALPMDPYTVGVGWTSAKQQSRSATPPPKEWVLRWLTVHERLLRLKLELEGFGLKAGRRTQVTFPLGLGQVDRELVHLCFTRLSGTRCSPPTSLSNATTLSSPPCCPHDPSYFSGFYFLKCPTNRLR
jgi:hypothetical protein